MAGYQKMLDIVQIIYETYTEFYYNSHIVDEIQFVPLQITYLPHNLKEVMREERKNLYICQ